MATPVSWTRLAALAAKNVFLLLSRRLLGFLFKDCDVALGSGFVRRLAQ